MKLENLKSILSKFIPAKALGFYSEINRRRKAEKTKKEIDTIIRKEGAFGVDELFFRLADLGIAGGKSIIVQSSLDAFKTFQGRADEIIDVLEKLVGKEGTICMPTYQKGFGKQTNLFFDVNRTPSAAGLLTEFFRRKTGAVRSLQPTHTVSSYGPLADYFTREHHLSPFPCGEKSAWTRIARVDGLLVGLGLPDGWTTAWHAVEAALGPDFPVEIFYPEERVFDVIDQEGKRLKVPVYVRKTQANIYPARFLDELPKGAHRFCLFHGVPLFVIEAEPFLRTMIEIAGSGRTIYD